MTSAFLKIDIVSFWHPGTGRSTGNHLDAQTHSDADGLPCLPGKHIKGLLRDAMERAEAYGWYDREHVTSTLLGRRPDKRHPSAPGQIRVGNASPADNVRQYLIRHPQARRHLYREHYSTSINPLTGVAETGTLRGIETIVPMTLYAPLVPLGESLHDTGFNALIELALPLINAVGGYRNRGFGEADVTLVQTPSGTQLGSEAA